MITIMHSSPLPNQRSLLHILLSRKNFTYVPTEDSAEEVRQVLLVEVGLPETCVWAQRLLAKLWVLKLRTCSRTHTPVFLLLHPYYFFTFNWNLSCTM